MCTDSLLRRLARIIRRDEVAATMTKEQPKRADSYNKQNPAYNPNTAKPSSGKTGKPAK